LADRRAVDGGVDVEVRLSQRRVVGGVGDEAVDALQAGLGAAHGGGEQLGRRAEVAVPAEPAVVRRVHVVVDVRDLVELVDRVAHALDVGAGPLVLLAVGHVEVGDQVGQRVDLDDRHDAQVAVLLIGQDVGDHVDVLGLVPLQAVLRDAQLAVGGQRRAVPVGQVVDDDLDGQRPAAVGLVLLDGLVQVVAQAHVVVTGRAGLDRGDPVQPHGGRLVGDGLAARLGPGLGRPVRVHVAVSALERVVHPLTRRGRGVVAVVVHLGGGHGDRLQALGGDVDRPGAVGVVVVLGGRERHALRGVPVGGGEGQRGAARHRDVLVAVGGRGHAHGDVVGGLGGQPHGEGGRAALGDVHPGRGDDERLLFLPRPLVTGAGGAVDGEVGGVGVAAAEG